MSFHKDLIGDDLHFSKLKLVEGTPIGNIVPDFVDQLVADSVNNAFYRATGETVDDWVQVGAAGEGYYLSQSQDVDASNRGDFRILRWNETESQHEYVDDMQTKSAGITGDHPNITDNGDGTISLAACQVVLYDNEFNRGSPTLYDVSGTTLTLVQGVTNYIAIEYNAGSPRYVQTQNVDLIDESTVIPVSTIFLEDSTIYRIDWDSLADGLTNKLHMRFVKTDRFEWESGLALTESTGRIVETTSGIVWYGGVRTPVLPFSSDTDYWAFWYHNNGEWTRDITTTTYNNTQYDDGTNLVTANNNNYLVNWIYRCTCDPSRGTYILGNQQYSSLAAAKDSQPPPAPPVISSVHFLVGRIIVEKNATSGEVETAFTKDFQSTGIVNHNDLSGLNDGDYQHLTVFERNKSVPQYTEKTEDYTLQLTDYTVGVICSTQNITITLPTAVDNTGKIFNVKKLDETGYRVILQTQTGETIDGESTKEILYRWTTLTFQSTGTDWIIL